MQQARSNKDVIPEIGSQEREGYSTAARTDLSSILNEYSNSQRRYNDRLELLEREVASLKGQAPSSITGLSSDEHDLNRTFTTKKPPIPQQVSARVVSPSRIPLPVTPRKLVPDDMTNVSAITAPSTRPLPSVPLPRSKTFHNETSHSSTNMPDEASLLRSYKVHLEQVLHKDAPTYSDIKIPNYMCIEDVIKANEQLLIENDRLRSELNRLKTESVLLLRSMKTAAVVDPNLGNERIMAERERQELNMELARQVEENKRLRKSLLAQSAKFLTLRHTASVSAPIVSTKNDARRTPESAPQPSNTANKGSSPKSARHYSGYSRKFVRANTFYHAPSEPT